MTKKKPKSKPQHQVQPFAFYIPPDLIASVLLKLRAEKIEPDQFIREILLRYLKNDECVIQMLSQISQKGPHLMFDKFILPQVKRKVEEVSEERTIRATKGRLTTK